MNIINDKTIGVNSLDKNKTINQNDEQTDSLYNDKFVDQKSSQNNKQNNSSETQTKNINTQIKKCPAKNCNKRLGISGVECRCGKITCMTHRHPESHDCSFNYKELGQNKLKKENPVIVADKMTQRI